MGDLLLAAARSRALDHKQAVELGLRALNEQREDDALPYVARSAGANPQPTLLHVLGLLHRARGDLAPALAAFDRAIAMGNASPKLIHARAHATLEAGLPSLDWYDRAHALAPNDGDIILGQAASLRSERSGEAADALLTATLREHPGWLPGHTALLRLRFASASGPFLAELDRALAGAPGDARLHQLKIMALHRAADGEGAVAAVAAARAVAGANREIAAAGAIIAAEHGTLADADVAFAGLDPFGDEDLMIHWLRHLLRRGEPERVSALAGRLPSALETAAWPYLSLAWRLLSDERRTWLDDERLVKVIDFGGHWPLLDPLAATLRGLHHHHSQPLDQSVRGGTQTDGHLFLRLEPVLVELKAKLAGEIATYLASLPPFDAAHPLLGHRPTHPRFVGSWSVRLTDGGFHEPHIHNMGRISSALYVELPPGGSLAAGQLVLGEPQSSLGLDLQPLRTIEPRRGRLVLFPSTLWHGTRPFTAAERLTVAFDVA